MKPIEFCLDTILLTLVENWNNYGDDRKSLKCGDILASFNLDEKYRKHEFFIGLIDKLRSDGYAEFIDENQAKEKDKITFYQENTIVTITGYYFILKKGGYEKEAKQKFIANIPKKYWWLTASAAFLLGFFSDIIKERLKVKQSQPSSKSQQASPKVADTPQTHKIHQNH